jgi:hypothetical protein
MITKMILFISMMFVCCTVDAKIDYTDQYEIEYRQERKKSVGQIIKEVMRRKEIKDESSSPMPLPMYDSIDWNRLKNLA